MKLIRDKLSEVIPAEQLSLLPPDGLQEALDAKLDEEVAELRASSHQDVREYADILEVLYAQAKRAGLTPDDIEKARLEKLAARGGFETGLMWTPPSKA